MESVDQNQQSEFVKCVFVLGAQDPEMKLIEEILNSLSLDILKATKDGKRVYPGNAYRADPLKLVSTNFSTLYAVECGWRGEPANVTHLDHHRPGDPGYGKPPTQYFSASSIGQVFEVVSRWLIRTGRPDDLDRLARDYGHVAHLAAAADHCLAAAYRDECPGVDADELMSWCVQRRAAFLKRPVSDILAELQSSRAIIRQMAVDGLADLRDLPHGTLPQAPQAACREGVAVLSRVTDRDHRQKVGLLGATEQQVSRFLSGQLVPDLVDRYGDPARGFAGGYIPPHKA